MTSHYTIAQYVPDPTADERMNIGVITWDESRVYSNFVSDFTRARAFGGQNVGFLREFTDYVSDLTKKTSNDYREFAPSRIDKLISSWTDSIQFTRPRGSTKSASQLISELPAVFLHVQEKIGAAVPRSSQTKAFAVRVAYKCIMDATKALAPKKARDLVQKNLQVRGRFNEHSFDIGLVNGSPFAAVNALPFGLSSRSALQKEIDASAWKFDDVRKRNGDLPLAVYIARAEHDDDALFEVTAKTFQGLKSQVISEERDMMKWADSQVHKKIAIASR
jgi:Protein of unknown function (DUF3037)